MDVLVVTWNYPPRRGGIESLIGSLCAELRKNHAVYVITAHAQVSGGREQNVFRSPLPGLAAFAVYAIWRGVILLASRSEIRVVFGGSALATLLVLLLARLFGRRAVVQAHGLDVIYPKFLYQQLCVRWLKLCDHVVANSRYTSQLVRERGVLAGRIAVIPPGIDLDRFSEPLNVDAVKQSWGIENRRIILFVGRLAKRKGVKEFIENSLVQIVREIPEACFLVVGDHPTESLVHQQDIVSAIKRAIARLGLERHVRLLGALSDDDLVKIYQICDVVVLPVLNLIGDVEGFGIVALEAATAGKPVVATRVGGIPDAVQDGKSGFLVAPGDYAGLGRVITNLLRDAYSRDVVGKYGTCRVREKFSWPRVARSYEKLILEVASCANSC